jgi:hypothetical protein
VTRRLFDDVRTRVIRPCRAVRARHSRRVRRTDTDPSTIEVAGTGLTSDALSLRSRIVMGVASTAP